MSTTRTPADDLAAELKRQGYYPHWHPSPAGFQCRLINSVINGVPQAEGDTIFDALDSARRHRDAMVAEGKYAKR